MKTLRVKNLRLEFDADQITSGTEREQALQAVEMINGILQRKPYGLGAKIVYGFISTLDVESEERDV